MQVKMLTPVRTLRDEQISVFLIASKSRVAAIGKSGFKMTIPRLELLAATIKDIDRSPPVLCANLEQKIPAYFGVIPRQLWVGFSGEKNVMFLFGIGWTKNKILQRQRTGVIYLVPKTGRIYLYLRLLSKGTARVEMVREPVMVVRRSINLALYDREC